MISLSGNAISFDPLEDQDESGTELLLGDRKGPLGVLYRAVLETYATGYLDASGDWCQSGRRVEVEFREYPILRHTPKGVVIDLGHYKPERFVRSNARKRFACPTKEEALRSFVARTARRLEHKRREVEDCERSLKIAKTMLGALSVPQESQVPNSQDDGDRSAEGVTLNPKEIT